MKRIKAFFRNKWTKRLLYTGAVVILLVIASNIWVNAFSSHYLYNSVESIAPREYGVVLGTSRQLKDGRKNWFFEYRIRAAVELYDKKKVKKLIVSGDNSTPYYDEPGMMKEELVKRGVPECAITCDYAGLRTYDSMVRMKKVFGVSSFIVISQKFHNQRAIFIARKNDMDVIGYNAKDLKGVNGIKTHVREFFSRFKTVLDIYLLGTDPKFMGKTEKINVCPA